MKKKFFTFIIIGLFMAVMVTGQERVGPVNNGIVAGSCSSVEVAGNTAVFHCENNIKVLLEDFGDDILKISVVMEGIATATESYAVIKKAVAEERINLSELTGSYEIYTGKLIIRVNKDPFGIRIFDKYQRLLMEDFREMGFVKGADGMTSFKTMRPGERIYGLGEKNGPINRTGENFVMWNSDRPCYQVHEDPLYKSIPFFMSSEGYGIYFDNTYKTAFDFGKESDAFYSFSTPGGSFSYYFIYGPSLKQILSGYTALTGQPMMPPSWAFGFSQSRGLLTNEGLTREIAREYRQRNIPCDIIYQDIGWTEHLQDFQWRSGNYDDPVQMIADLESEGFKVIVSQDPVISKRNVVQWEDASSLGYFVNDIRTGAPYDMPWPWGGNCGVVDFTNPQVADWWGAYQQKAVDAGVRGFWTDMGEPAWSNEEDRERLHMQHFAGMHDEIHNVYGLTWDKVVTEEFEKRNPGMRIFQMTRAGFAGMQRYTFGWSGDAGNGNDVTDGWGQLAAQVPMAMSAGMGLIPFWSCDISGYCGDIVDYEAMEELYIRWLQFGAFNPLSRIHHEGNNAVEPWIFGERAEAISREIITLKYRLFPYIYSYAREAYDKGWPLIRPLVMEYPGDMETFDLNTQFMFGEELLVAPVVEEGASRKKIYLPAGSWIDFNNPSVHYSGKQWIEYPVILEQIPLFVKGGSVIPQMPPMQFIGEIQNHALIVEIFPALENRDASFEVYEDDGETNNYKQHIFTKREIRCSTTSEGYEVNYKVTGHNGHTARERDLRYLLHSEEKPSTVRISGKKIKPTRGRDKADESFDKIEQAEWTWDKDHNLCIISIPVRSATELLIIEN